MVDACTGLVNHSWSRSTGTTLLYASAQGVLQDDKKDHYEQAPANHSLTRRLPPEASLVGLNYVPNPPRTQFEAFPFQLLIDVATTHGHSLKLIAPTERE